MRRIILLIVVGFLSVNVGAAPISTTGHDLQIKAIYTYHKGLPYGGQIIVKMQTLFPSCEDGFWLSKEDIDANSNLSAYLLSAFHASSSVYLAADNGLRWPHSSTNTYCKISTVGLTK